jgi:hypothetical protein
LTATRLFAEVSLATDVGWTLFEPAVIDTGAPVSVFPPAIWKPSRHTPLGRVKIGGLARREECQLPAILAEIDCTLSDGRRSLGPIRMHAYLVEIENAPTLLGVLGFIERGVLRVDLSKDRAFLRMP